MVDRLIRAQFEDAKSRMAQSVEGLGQRVRSTWSHIIYPVPVHDGGNGSGPATGFELEHTSAVNRAPGKPIAQVVYDKLRGNSVIVDELGPETLMAELGKVWGEDKPHIEVATLLDWFASYVYLPRLRDDATLTLSIEKLIQKIEAAVAFADSFDEESGEYEGVSLWATSLGSNIANGLLVWRSALPEKDTVPGGAGGAVSGGGATVAGGAEFDGEGEKTRGQPRRFFGSIPLDSDKAGLQVAKIAEEILFELRRPNGATVSLTLEIDASSPAGYPEDVVDVVRSNVRDLKLDTAEVGFEEE